MCLGGRPGPPGRHHGWWRGRGANVERCTNVEWCSSKKLSSLERKGKKFNYVEWCTLTRVWQARSDRAAFRNEAKTTAEFRACRQDGGWLCVAWYSSTAYLSCLCTRHVQVWYPISWGYPTFGINGFGGTERQRCLAEGDAAAPPLLQGQSELVSRTSGGNNTPAATPGSQHTHPLSPMAPPPFPPRLQGPSSLPLIIPSTSAQR